MFCGLAAVTWAERGKQAGGGKWPMVAPGLGRVVVGWGVGGCVVPGLTLRSQLRAGISYKSCSRSCMGQGGEGKIARWVRGARMKGAPRHSVPQSGKMSAALPMAASHRQHARSPAARGCWPQPLSLNSTPSPAGLRADPNSALNLP